MPELLYKGFSHELANRPVMVLRYVPGADAEEALPDLDRGRCEALFSDFGDAVGRLHRIGLPRFTDRIGTPEENLDQWSDVVGKRARSAAGRNRALGVAEIEAIVDRLGRAAEGVSEAVELVLIHHDFYLVNVLVRAGRFAALIDLEQAKAWIRCTTS